MTFQKKKIILHTTVKFCFYCFFKLIITIDKNKNEEVEIGVKFCCLPAINIIIINVPRYLRPWRERTSTPAIHFFFFFSLWLFFPFFSLFVLLTRKGYVYARFFKQVPCASGLFFNNYSVALADTVNFCCWYGLRASSIYRKSRWFFLRANLWQKNCNYWHALAQFMMVFWRLARTETTIVRTECVVLQGAIWTNF